VAIELKAGNARHQGFEKRLAFNERQAVSRASRWRRSKA
jgi:hypothetical protein